MEQDIDGKATDFALAWSIGLGAPFTFMTTLEREYKSDIFGERAILLGGVHGIVEFLFRHYQAAGMTPEEAFVHSTESVTDPILRTISCSGIKGLCESLPEKDKAVFRRAYGAAYAPSYEIHYENYSEVASGNEIRSVILSDERMKKIPMGKIDGTTKWKVGEKVRAARVAGKGDAAIPLDPFTAGVYAASMMAQIDLLAERGHAYSEIVNESVIEAVDSLNPFMHYKGVAFMVDNCSITARLGARKWAPRYDYLLTQQAEPLWAGGKGESEAVWTRFLDHPVHEALAAAASMRPSVDIAVRGLVSSAARDAFQEFGHREPAGRTAADRRSSTRFVQPTDVLPSNSIFGARSAKPTNAAGKAVISLAPEEAAAAFDVRLGETGKGGIAGRADGTIVDADSESFTHPRGEGWQRPCSHPWWHRSASCSRRRR